MNIGIEERSAFWKRISQYVDALRKSIVFDSEKSIAYIYDKNADLEGLTENKSDKNDVFDIFNIEYSANDRPARYYAKISIDDLGIISLNIKNHRAIQYVFNFPKKEEAEEFDKTSENIFQLLKFFELPLVFYADSLSSTLFFEVWKVFNGKKDKMGIAAKAEDIDSPAVDDNPPLLYFEREKGKYILRPGDCFDGEAEEIFVKLSRKFGWDKGKIAEADETSGLFIPEIGCIRTFDYGEFFFSLWFIEHTNFNEGCGEQQSRKKKIYFTYSGLGVYHEILTFIDEHGIEKIEKLDFLHSPVRMVFAKRKDGKFVFQGLFFLSEIYQDRNKKFTLSYMRFEGGSPTELIPYSREVRIFNFWEMFL